ncbi:MAG: 2-isopropylmalate synthase, 2-isopropylmalate synthase [Candidatus Peregrinibacteria bacterium GW2011_GWF2_33_10]|nr:MAG: 2-isopropylmalate synthase, 2-isopropylmalate synthase [Candidatus Peregrinibacteria bacterium GW2011_GWF2_33_10]OGJ45627.1 MAG: 2-isopropylmalate synthase [Candidatus Peregrinibacteria bacterium RIFOXYA2_FULL_33_21]OGJ46576.1 MAG: 2-isopropylmalate synthase [Candidatus Peregrinibacteria bacterium RIFOXYA12_FULL_33_12]OGJ51218.1 MAG: 2-isopropylmalate synthase [Candidatus Peregrinibacteria bacterium RIFOXYB2_FULL_33_20]
MPYLRIFDTTLRDGEQSPGFSMNVSEKMRLARQLEKLNVDVIEAGFPMASEDDFQAVKAIAEQLTKPEICGLARCLEKDIQTAWEALKNAKKPRIHTFLATSDIHLQHKLKITRNEALKTIKEMVTYAKSLCPRVDFSPEDALRSDLGFLYEALTVAIEAGADVLNIPDTVGYSLPYEFGKVIQNIKKNVKNIDKVIISTHCHNDLGLAVANSLSGVLNGARQVECTINGIGERAGNAALEEVVMAVKTRPKYFGVKTQIKTKEIYKTSKLLTQITGIGVQPNKAIVGANAFAHEAGIHQDGILKERSTYEIMKASDLGIKEESKLVLGKHSGRHAFSKKLKELGHDLSKEQINKAFIEFKNLADKKKEIFDEDLEVIAQTESGKSQETWTLSQVQISSGNISIPTASVQLKNLKTGEIKMTAATGTGPVDAIYQGIENIMGVHPKLTEFSMLAVTAGIDAQAEVTAKILYKGKTITGRGASTDIIVASTLAYINALNRALNLKK